MSKAQNPGSRLYHSNIFRIFFCNYITKNVISQGVLSKALVRSLGGVQQNGDMSAIGPRCDLITLAIR